MKIIVIGGGMSGMTAAIALGKKGHKVTLIESNARVGKKLLQTGNGRCNIFNADFDENRYNDSALAKKLACEYNTKVVDFLQDTGIMLSSPDDQGRVYPLTDSANSVVDCLRAELGERATVVTDCKAEKIKENGDSVTVVTTAGEFSADRVIVAVGSNIAVKDYNGENLAENIMTKRFPSLTTLKALNALPSLNGVRLSARATLYRNKDKAFCEDGEVLFKEYGLGGIVTLNMSAVIARDMVKEVKASYAVSLDAFPEMSKTELAELLTNRLKKFGSERMLVGVVQNKIAEAVLKILNIKQITEKNITDIASVLKNFSFKIEGLVDKSMAQVCAGGVDEKFLDGVRLKNSNVFYVGEILNVDGMCGGYNLFFACASALFAADTIK